MVNCPKCDALLDVDEDELDEGDSLTCEECGADLNVVGLDPLELEVSEEEDDEEETDDADYGEDEDEDEEEEEEEKDWH